MINKSPSTNALLWLMLGLSLGASPHFSYQPLWVMLIFMTMIGWRCMNLWRNWPLPSKQHRSLTWLQLGIAAIATLLLVRSYGNFIGRDAGVALLTVMLGLKVIEIRSHRDYYLSCFLGYFLVVTNFFYSQTIPTASLMFVVVIIMTTCLISLNSPIQSLDSRSRLKLANQMLLQAIPLMLVLFVFFPRIEGPLWGLPQDAYGAKTGIDDSMTLGNISQLILSDEIAFRVKFDGDIPNQSVLYWRGPVLWETDGTTWTELTRKKQNSATPNISNTHSSYQYSTMLEPHNNHWLFALDFPTTLPITLKTHLTQDGQLRADAPVRQRVQYQLNSHTQFQFNVGSDVHLADALQLPADKHQRTKQLAQQWRNHTQQPSELVQLALDHFSQQNFFYTLSPPQLAGDSIDGFLFESRRGFCEHYAASFTVLMRAAGVPARIVTGYLGGEINPVDGVMLIRQRDAHAWTEIWIEGDGWLRVDPTAAVSKERIEHGINTIMPFSMRSPMFISHSRQLFDIWQQLSNNWDALNTGWDQWILAYGPKLQKEFLSKLGMPAPNWQSMVILLTLSITTLLLIISLFLFYQYKRHDPIVQLYQRFCNKLARLGIVREPSEGPLDFAIRACKQLPTYQHQIMLISHQYTQLRYSLEPSVSLVEYRREIRQFNPKQE
ncbi:MAG: DUF3488 and transglutaminase-like domain-containing protein [Gammaproteobacteria bacterium]|nr:DUF3488 and transglutaminase-like domain-containing protein [Gammaproteobacteria bacterium]MDH5591259.1 DUF3488 and transglutaminase-like domain-containing protein [Gammaproteobacteria bacterium]